MTPRPPRSESSYLELDDRQQAPDPEDLWCVADQHPELWTFSLKEIPLVGGWKVARLDIADPMIITDWIGSTWAG